MSGKTSYVEKALLKTKVCIISDSIAQRINMGMFNRELKSATAYKVIFPGATVDKFKKYLKTTLEDDQFDAILINVGGNNVSNKRIEKSDVVITADIMEMIELCKTYGIDNIYISGIRCRPRFQGKIESINEMLKCKSTLGGYVYTDNGNIKLTTWQMTTFTLITMASNY